MNENNSLSDLEQMRSQMVELKSMLKEQSIVNGKMMRKAMKSDYNRMRNDMKFSIVFEVLALPMMWYVLPMLGLPLWFVAVTVLFLLSALAASVYSLLHYASGDLMNGNLTDVALKIVRYKRFGIYWFFYAIPFLVFWLGTFFYFVTKGEESEFVEGVVYGGIIGGVIGGTLGIVNYVQNLHRMNRILKQIREVKAG